jgi:hypothetical protein
MREEKSSRKLSIITECQLARFPALPGPSTRFFVSVKGIRAPRLPIQVEGSFRSIRGSLHLPIQLSASMGSQAGCLSEGSDDRQGAL